MRVILDTNVLLSAVMKRETPPARLYRAWREGRFELVSCEEQLAEIRDVSRRPQLRGRLRPAYVGAMVNEIRQLALLLEPTEGITASTDPSDNYLLGLADAGQVDFLVTGDKRDLLSLGRMAGTQIATARAVLAIWAYT